MTALLLAVASVHFETTLAKQNQPNTIALHLEFVRRTQVGLAVLTVKDVKLGRQTSTIHVILSQGDREEVMGYITNSNMHTESGLTLDTGFTLHPAPRPAFVDRLRQDNDPHWQLQKDMPFADFRKASQKVKYFLPREGQHHRSMADEWITFANGERFTDVSLGYVADTWPQLVESYVQDSTMSDSASESEVRTKENGWAGFWYPTLLLNLDVKKALPVEGVEFLFVRVRAKAIKCGRLDLEVVILDEEGDIVALSHQVSLILDASRNMAARGSESDKRSQL